MKRPYLSTALPELIAISDRTTDHRVLSDVLAELGHRTTQGARRLEASLRQRLATTPPPADLFSDQEKPAGAFAPSAKAPSVQRHPGRSPAAAAAQKAVRRRATPRKPEYPPTDEQKISIDAFMSGESLKVTAFAGAGKTSTLVQMADQRDGAGLYLAFNKSIANEARSAFLPSVDCRTTHSVAVRAVRASRPYRPDKLFTNIGAKQLAAVLNLKSQSVADVLSLSDVQQAYLLLATIRRFCQSAGHDIRPSHVPNSGRLAGIDDAARTVVMSAFARDAALLWSRMIDPADDLPMGHDGYLKLWSLSDPVLDHEYILMDEAQDTNPAVMHVLERQKAQVIYVGDPHQQIYAWRGAVNAMAQAQTVHETDLTQSFRFGDEIAGAATSILRALDEQRSIRGNPKMRSRISESGLTRTVLTRTNTMVISEVIDALERGQKPHIVGGTDEMLKLVTSVYELMDGKPASHPDFFGFKNWDQVVAFSETDEGAELRTFVGLVRKYGHSGLYRALKKTVAEEADADIVLSTAHKSKGRQWPSVRIADDFGGVQSDNGSIPVEETRLFYVAITRAQEHLVVASDLLAGFQRGELPKKPEADHAARVSAKPAPAAKRKEPAAEFIAAWSGESARPPEPIRQPTPAPSPKQPPAPKKKGFIARLFGR